MARTGSVAWSTPTRSPRAEASDAPATAAAATGTQQRGPLSRGPSRADVGLRGGPLAAEGQDLGGAGVRPCQVERTVGVLRQGGRQLGAG